MYELKVPTQHNKIQLALYAILRKDWEVLSTMALTRDEIDATLRSLAQSQGFYERLVHASNYTDVLDILEREQFEDVVEMITAIEE